MRPCLLWRHMPLGGSLVREQALQVFWHQAKPALMVAGEVALRVVHELRGG